MIDRLAHVEVDPKRATRDFWKRYHAYRRIRDAETRPEDPVTPDDIVERQMQRDDPFETRYHFEIAHNPLMLSWFTASTSKPGSPGHDSNKHIMWFGASVHPNHRRAGIGRAWIPLAVELMERHGCSTFSSGAEEESGHAFLRWLGAEAKLSGAENRLKLADVDWAMVRRWAEDGPRRSPASRLEVYDGHLPEDMWDAYSRQRSAMLNTVPLEQLDIGEITVTPAQMAEWYLLMDMAGMTHHTMLTREPDGVISGITDVKYFPYRPKLIYQGFTGVRPDARRRGLGKWLKAAMLMHVRDRYPKVEVVVTDNGGSNVPMLAINTKLGFKQFLAGSDYQMSRDRLAARILWGSRGGGAGGGRA
jgi:GNAT superfamily N-acetyltransferase